MAGLVKWTFVDDANSDSYVFAVNPNAGGTPKLEKNLTYVNTAAPNGRVLAFEGRDKQKEGKFSGTLRTQEEYEAFQTWYDKRVQIIMTDDLERTFNIYITGFDAERVRAATAPWKHNYTVTYVIIDWT